ncbi:MAG: Wzz/FepE/Etk N-terminal domain-containing protein [Prevotellaceae bacterium]|nr:Wzz/FepE/Etk N-terminal domain-containing protein [Prevotellaceae bacterium]
MSNAQNDTDIISLFILLWKRRRLVICNCTIAFVLSVIVAFSIPKEYTSDVIVAPELSVGESGLSGGLSSLAQMAGVDLGGLSGNEALYPELYPEIVSSTPFLIDMLKMEVESKDGEIKADLYDYLTTHQKGAWWGIPFKFLKRLLKSKGDADDGISIYEASSVQLTRDQILLLESFSSMLNVQLDKTTSLITVSATMQDPLIAATVAQAVADKLQAYVDKYHTVKERENVAYLENLYEESKIKYKKIQEEYTSYADSHQNAFLASVKAKQTDLENEMQLSYSICTQVAQQLEAANAKLQEKKPVIVVIQPAMTPIKASSPKKVMLVFIYVFFTLFFTAAWIIVKNRLVHYPNKLSDRLENQ